MDGLEMERWKARDRLLAMDGSARNGRLGDGALDGSQWMVLQWTVCAMDCATGCGMLAG